MISTKLFLDSSKELFGDSNPCVEMNTATINKLLTALNECTEWGQIFILDSLSS